MRMPALKRGLRHLLGTGIEDPSCRQLPGKTSALHHIRQLSEVEAASLGRPERLHFKPDT
jgi:hypothetical protein